MIKSDLDDTFRVSFPGGPESEYWIEASDLLGNGPATWGSSSKAYAVGGKAAPGKTVASSEAPAPKAEPKRARKTPAPAKTSEPPAIQYIRPTEPPAEGNPFTMRMRIQSDSPVAVAVLQARAQGTAAFVNLPLTKAEGDTWQAQIPAAMAHGTIEYFIAAKNQAGQMTRQGESEGKPYGLTFKSAAPTAATPAAMTISTRPAGPFSFTGDPPARVPPGRPILVRAQVVPPTDSGEMPDRVAVLWRGNDAQDQMTDMVKDETGGWGGFKVELPPQEDGAVFFQIVACDAAATRCGVDTGSRRRWHAACTRSAACCAVASGGVSGRSARRYRRVGS